MGRKPQPVEVVTADEAGRHELSERVQCRRRSASSPRRQEGPLALSGGVLAELMEEDVVDVVGPRSKPDSACVAFRHRGSLGIS